MSNHASVRRSTVETAAAASSHGALRAIPTAVATSEAARATSKPDQARLQSFVTWRAGSV
jgi:hypothetical protein